MEYVKVVFEDGSYSFDSSNSVKITILGCFFASDVRCSGRNFFRDWALSGESEWAVSGNITCLERVGEDIVLYDLYSEEEIPTELRMTCDQLVALLDEWQEKVCKNKPKEVIIKHEKDRFFIEALG